MYKSKKQKFHYKSTSMSGSRSTSGYNSWSKSGSVWSSSNSGLGSYSGSCLIESRAVMISGSFAGKLFSSPSHMIRGKLLFGEYFYSLSLSPC